MILLNISVQISSEKYNTKKKLVAQGQYVVSDTRCPALSDSELEGGGSRAAAPKGTKSCRTQGDFRPSIISSVHHSVRPPGPLRPEICPLRPEICPLRP